MAKAKTEKKPGAKKAPAAKPAVTAKKAAAPGGKTVAAAGVALPEQAPPAVRRAAGPNARTCPLVMDGEVDAADFSPSDCLTCSEFDCRFCEAEEGSGALRSRLFAAGDEGDDEEDGWGGDVDFDGAEEAGGVDEPDDEGTF